MMSGTPTTSDQPNLFNFATSELSQDAFIAWLANWADPNFASIDPLLNRCAHNFIIELVGAGGRKVPFAEIESVEVFTQQYRIDVLVVVNKKYHLLVEDKTDTSLHTEQIDRYIEELVVKKGVPAEHIYAVYFKTGNESNCKDDPVKNYRHFLRGQFLDVLDVGKQSGIANQIFVDYFEYLREIEEATESFRYKPIEEWCSRAWEGFYLAIEEKLQGEWGYVANASGGFLAFYWASKKLSSLDDVAYLQLESTGREIELSGEIPAKTKLLFRVSIGGDDPKVRRDRAGDVRDRFLKCLFATAKEHHFIVSRTNLRLGSTMAIGMVECYSQKSAESECIDLDATVRSLMRAEEVLMASVEAFKRL